VDQAHSDQADENQPKVAGAPSAPSAIDNAAPAVQALTGQPTRIITDDSHTVQGLPPAPEVVEGIEGGAATSEAETLRAELDAIKAELETVRKSDAEALDQRVSDLANKVELQKSAALQRVLHSMGVKEHLRKYAPEVDVDTQDGRQKLQKWAQENPELVGSGMTDEAPAFSPDQLKEKFRSPHLVNASLLRGKK
jgi:hypothetical protein